jgi:hypothetical protein
MERTKKASSQADKYSACHDTPSAHSSWKDLIARQLRNHDPAHATQYAELAAAIIDDNVTALGSYIRAGISPDTILHLATPLSLLELSVGSCNGYALCVKTHRAPRVEQKVVKTAAWQV